jgi:hypothetical protein
MREEKQWVTRPINQQCEVMVRGRFCGMPTTHAYPAMGGGWMSLCHHHAQKHIGDSGTQSLTELFRGGETLITRL